MADTCKTVKVKPWHASQGAFVEINADDYDPQTHCLSEPVDKYPHLTPKQEEALDHVMDGVVKPGGSPKGGNRKRKAS
jgi:hypothetical protein